MSTYCTQAPTRETQKEERVLMSGHSETPEGTTLKETLEEAWLPLVSFDLRCFLSKVAARAWSALLQEELWTVTFPNSSLLHGMQTCSSNAAVSNSQQKMNGLSSLPADV